jgi:hypothetical protein
MDQITINLTPELREFLRMTADRESRSMAGQARHYIVEAARRAGHTNGSLTPLPVRPEIRNGEELAEAKERLTKLESKRDALVAHQRKSRFGLLPDQDQQLRNLYCEIPTLSTEIQMAERMLGDAQ